VHPQSEASIIEGQQAAELARYLGGTSHRVIILDAEPSAEELRSLIWRLDEPLADLTSLAYDAICRTSAADDVPVLLTGHGADELFWGYQWLHDALVAEESRCSTLSEGKLGIRPSIQTYHPDFRSMQRAAPKLYGPFLRDRISRDHMPGDGSRFFPPGAAPARLQVCLSMLETYLRTNGLQQMDRIGMSHGVEVRLPFVSSHLIEMTLAILGNSANLTGKSKWLLRDAAKDILPPVLCARAKRPFLPYGAASVLPLIVPELPAMLEGELVRRGILSQLYLRENWVHKPETNETVTVAYRCWVLEQWLSMLLRQRTDTHGQHGHAAITTPLPPQTCFRGS
jgi:asparagine synthase (glutamine-hydrolysing)